MPEQPVKPEPTIGTAADEVGTLREPVEEPRVDAADAAELAIIVSKIEPPVLGDAVLTRSRLVGWLDQQTRARVMLLSAEAGYGKSTLLGDFSRRTEATCMWYRLETSDGDWITFLSHLVAAFRRVYPGFGRSTEALLRHVAAMGPSREVVAATFLSDLGTLGSATLVLILDDYHFVEGSDDVRTIMARLLERAPATMKFVLAGRGKPDLPIGRLAAQGRVAELTTNDLRFTRAEIEELFESKYGQPLARETCDIVERRTEGWAASLQLVSASIAVSRPSEVGHFIEALSGARGPIYDFLAEEVLSRLAPLTQRVLVHASLVDRVTYPLVSAALSEHSALTKSAEVEACLREVETLGLLSRRDGAVAGSRIHPLLREFLAHQLEQEYSPDAIRAMHLAIARASEPSDWLLAGKHFALAGQHEQAMQVLGAAASQALGTGAWGAAAEIAATMPNTPPPPSVEVIKARALIDSERPEAAVRLLDQINADQLDDTSYALVELTRAAALHTAGRSNEADSHLATVTTEALTPAPLRQVASAWQQMLVANQGGSISAVAESLETLSEDLGHEDLHYYMGITSHNWANAELARGRYGHASELASDAVVQLSKTTDGGGILASTRLISAAAMAEMGRVNDALEMAIDVASSAAATADSIAEAAYMCAVGGRSAKAKTLLARFGRGDARGSRELSSRAQALYALVASALSDGKVTQAKSALEALKSLATADIDSASRVAVVEATVALVAGDRDAARKSATATETCESQGAWRWMARARILDAVARRDSEGLLTWLEDADKDSALALLEMADVVAGAVDLVANGSNALDETVVKSPSRWVPALGRQVEIGTQDVSASAASLVARFGSIDDASVLRDYDRAEKCRPRRRGYVTKLIRRVSPTVRLHDLGPTSYQIGNRLVTLAETRRKAASLLLYLASRSGLAATREQAMESLWPDQSPKSALNSLHQTLFFLRRDIEPWHEEGQTADYVRMESDLVYLDPELFQIDSVAFARQCTDILSTKSAASRGPELIKLYSGRFAPEFEYEEWAQEWRAQLHGAFLHLAHSTAESLMQETRHAEAIDILSVATSVDMLAYDLRSMLVASLSAVGSVDAARAHYESMASLHLRDLGVPATPYDAIVAGVFSMD